MEHFIFSEHFIMVNIVEAMTQFNGQYIVMVSGLSGSGRTKLARFIAETFKFKLVDMKNFNHTKEYYEKPENYINLGIDTKILNWDDIEKSVNWIELNNTVIANKATGVVVVGLGFPNNHIKFLPDQHIHIKISKDKLFENRHKYLKSHPDDPNNKYMGTPIEKQIFNQLINPIYIRMRDASKIDRFINMSELDIESAKKMIYIQLINFTTKWLDIYEKEKKTPPKTTKRTTPLNINYDGNQKAYDEYFHNKKRIQYDFNQEGDDIPPIAIMDDDEELVLKSTSSIDDTSDSDAEFLWTTKN